MVPPILQAYQTLGRGDLKLPKGDDGDGDVLGGVMALGSDMVYFPSSDSELQSQPISKFG